MVHQGHLIWWSTNTRAASVLTAASVTVGVPVAVIWDPAVPPPSEEVARQCLMISRPRVPVTVDELQALNHRVCTDLGVSSSFLAPTSEYLTDFVLEAGTEWASDGLATYPQAGISYRRLSSKSFPYEADHGLSDDILPRRLQGSIADVPFVAKPIWNLDGAQTLKPFLVHDEASLRTFEASKEVFFAQEWIGGPSRYLCGFMASSGDVTAYVQRNILQEPHGGSISLAVRDDGRALASRTREVIDVLRAVGFAGPFMVEFRGERATLIDLNPRFWGPLLLDLTSRGGVLRAYFQHVFNVELNESLICPSSDVYAVPRLLQASVSVDSSLTSVDPVPSQETLIGSLLGWDPSQLGGDW